MNTKTAQHTPQRRYALVENDNEAGQIFSVGGTWSYWAADEGATLMTGPEADKLAARHPHARIVDMIVRRQQHAIWFAGFRSVIPDDFKGQTTPELRQAARDAARDAVLRAGFTIAKAEGRAS